MLVRDGSLMPLNYVTATDYDAADNAVQVTDPRGLRVTALYDFRNRLVDQTTAAGTADASRTTLQYDGEDNLVALTNPRKGDIPN